MSVAWGSALSPDSFQVDVMWPSEAGAWMDMVSATAEGDARNLAVPASSLPAPKELSIRVEARNQGLFGGDCAAGCQLDATSYSDSVTVTR